VAFDGALKMEVPAIEGTRGERTTAGLMPLGLFLFHYYYPAVRTGLVIHIFFYPAVRTGSSNTRFFFTFFFRGHLPQTSARSKEYLPVIFVRFAFIRQNFMKVGVENYWRFNGIKTPLVKAITKVLASFEAGMNSLNLPWDVNITSLKHGSRFGKSLAFAKLNNSTVNASIFLAVLLCLAKIFRESCVEKYKTFNGVDFSSMRARTKVLASFKSQ